MTKRSYLSRTQIVQGHEWLKSRIEVLRPPTETTRALVRYRNGEDDTSLTAHLGCNLDQAKRLRSELFGDLIQIRPIPDTSAHEKLLNQAELIGKLALVVANLAEKLGETEISVLARGIVQDVSLADL